MWSLKPFKAPRPNGLYAGFFQCFWLLTGELIIKSVKDVFGKGKFPEHLNKTLINLIPKRPGADCLGSFISISLYNTVYKVITKFIVARMRPLLPNIISPMQTTFVLGRKDIDNVIIIQEILHTMSGKKGRMGSMAIKKDSEKAYDRLEWSFIISCITSSSVEVLLNEGIQEKF